MFERIFKFSGQPDILPISRPAYGEPSNKQPGYKRQILNTFTFFKTENSTGTFVDMWMKVTNELELNNFYKYPRCKQSCEMSILLHGEKPSN